MTKVEKAANGLHCCQSGDCEHCPYGDLSEKFCKKTMLSDAESILRQHIKPSKRKLPCLCGRKHLDLFYGFGENVQKYSFQCPYCGRKAGGASELEAIQNWNKMVSQEKE